MTLDNLAFSADGKNLTFRVITGASDILIKSLLIKKYNDPEYTDISEYESTFREYDDRCEYEFDILLASIGIEDEMNMLYLHVEDDSDNVVEDVCSYVADVFFCLYQTIISMSDDNVPTPEYLAMSRLYMLLYAHVTAMDLDREEEAEYLFERIVEAVENWDNKYLPLDPYPVINN